MDFGPEQGQQVSGYVGGQYLNATTPTSAPTLQQRLDYAVQRAEEQLAEAKEARDIFSRNPDLERLLNIMQKGRF